MKSSKNETVTIVRKAKKSKYSIISNTLLQDVNLSWKAKGILCYLLHLPDDWKINLIHLQKQATDGRESLKSGFKELKEKGYVEHQTIREKGKILSHIWIVHEEPILKNDRDDKEPEAGKPSSGFTTCGKSATTNNLYSESKDSESILKTKESVETATLSADADSLVSFFIEKIKERKTDFKLPDRKRWLLEIDRMIRIDKRDPKKIKSMIEWIHRDSFWSKNILSPQKLREKYDQIELHAIGKYEKANVQKNKIWALHQSKKYPQTYKNIFFSDHSVCNQQTGKEALLSIEHQKFKRIFTKLYGIEYDDLSPSDK